VTLLTAELEAGSDHLDDAVRAFLAAVMAAWLPALAGDSPPNP
jgi:hypothetical protein